MIPHVLSVFVVQWENLKKKLYSFLSDPMPAIISLGCSTSLKVSPTITTHLRLPCGSDKK